MAPMGMQTVNAAYLVIQNQRGSAAVVRAWATADLAHADIALMKSVRPDVELSIRACIVLQAGDDTGDTAA